MSTLRGVGDFTPFQRRLRTAQASPGGDRIQATLVFERDDLSAINSDSDEQDVAAGPGSDIAEAIAEATRRGHT